MLTAALCEAPCALHTLPRPPWGRGVGNRLLGLVPEVVAPPLRAEKRPPKSRGVGGAPNAEDLLYQSTSVHSHIHFSQRPLKYCQLSA